MRNSIFVQCAHVRKKSIPIWSLWHINAHINPITLFSVHVNTTFKFINRNEFRPIEPQIVHVNVANDAYGRWTHCWYGDEDRRINESIRQYCKFKCWKYTSICTFRCWKYISIVRFSACKNVSKCMFCKTTFYVKYIRIIMRLLWQGCKLTQCTWRMILFECNIKWMHNSTRKPRLLTCSFKNIKYCSLGCFILYWKLNLKNVMFKVKTKM